MPWDPLYSQTGVNARLANCVRGRKARRTFHVLRLLYLFAFFVLTYQTRSYISVLNISEL